jgi:hypothetical protein
MTISMKGALVALALCLIGGDIRADSPLPPPNLPVDTARDPAWRSLFARLAERKTLEAAFEERRYFLFRKIPVLLTGEIRIAPGRGLSLAYLTPEPRILIADDRGLLLRDRRGRDFAAPAGGRAQAATAVLIDVIRFNLAELRRAFEFRGRLEGDAWILALKPNDPALSADFDSIVIFGKGARLRRIELTGSAATRIEILIGETREGVTFTQDELSRYFR